MNAPFTRRAALAGALVAVPVLGGASLAAMPPMAILAGLDPVFAAIERHKEAWRLYGEACPLTDSIAGEQEGRVITAADEATFEAVIDAENAALADLFETPPHTVAGMRTMIEYIVKFDEGCLPEASGPLLATLLKSPLLAA